ncbi:MAG: hydroxymethylbilane synthase [Deltaproteobacteria bacterium HGW-Deltaproteobacteria-15]|jgi:hydroxymethylbilane synthase|nr:MAG: hydroxymethylbilane synthase [Deltaproteobacteria bacterium HGW-Deltaproteobacteria-15]
MTILKIGTRGSKLALTQSGWVKERIESAHPEARVELIRIRTTGDKMVDSPLSKIGGKGLFVKEIETALLAEEVDLAVHSMKDVPAELPPGLEAVIYPQREDARDALVSREFLSFQDLPKGAAVGTGSLRRSTQLLFMRPDLKIVPIRGNVDTRIQKMDSGELDAVILAVAGLNRLGLSEKIGCILNTGELLPAIGQGALCLETRRGNQAVLDLLRFIHHEETELTVRAERAFLKALGGGCQVPIAGHARLAGEGIILEGVVAELDGSRVLRDHMAGTRENPEGIGEALARRLLSAGADKILARIYEQA